jgi:signal transduction histidine kinase
MLNSGDILLTDLFFLLLPVISIIITAFLITYFYIKRFRRVFYRYKIQKLEEVENERKRIANDLHDFAGGKLLKIKRELQLSLSATNNSVIKINIAEGLNQLDRFHDDIRHLVEYIYPKELLIGNIQASFISLGNEMSNSFSSVIMDVESFQQLPIEKAHHLFRLVQEKVSNIIVYQKPKEIYIGLYEDMEDNQVELSISFSKKFYNQNFDTHISRKYKGRGETIISERLKILNAKTAFNETETEYKETTIFPII